MLRRIYIRATKELKKDKKKRKEDSALLEKSKEDVPSFSLNFVSITSFSQWKISCRGSPLIMEKDEREIARVVGCAEGAGNRMTGGSRILLSLRIEVFPAYGAPDGECDTMICALQVITNLMKGEQAGSVVQSLGESINKSRLAEALGQFIAVDNASVSVTMGEMSQNREVHEIVSPRFVGRIYGHAFFGAR